jgi:hypothetical protein
MNNRLRILIVGATGVRLGDRLLSLLARTDEVIE